MQFECNRCGEVEEFDLDDAEDADELAYEGEVEHWRDTCSDYRYFMPCN